MSDSVIEKALLDAIAKECSDVSGRITTYLTLRERILATGGVLIAAAGTIGIVNKHYWVLVLVPAALAVLLSFTTYINSEATALGGYRAALEERFNTLVGQPALFWESHLAPRRHRDSVTKGIVGVMTLLVLASTGLAIFSGYEFLSDTHFSSAPHWWFVLVSLGLTIGAIASLLRAMRAEGRLYEEMRSSSVGFLNGSTEASAPEQPLVLQGDSGEPSQDSAVAESISNAAET